MSLWIWRSVSYRIWFPERKRIIFQRGPNNFSGVKCFFPVENSHFRRPKTNFSGFEKWKTKKQKTKQTHTHTHTHTPPHTPTHPTHTHTHTPPHTPHTPTPPHTHTHTKSSPHFVTFLLPLTIFHLPFHDFSSFLHFLFFLVSLFPVGHHKLPGEKCLGALYPCLLPGCYGTVWFASCLPDMKQSRNLMGESGRFMPPVLTLWGGGHIAHYVWRWVIVPSDLVRSFGSICAYYCYRVIHRAITYLCAWFESTRERQLTLNEIAWRA